MTDVFHITHVGNLAAIMAHGGLVSDSRLAQLRLAPIGIAHQHIKQRRATTTVPLPMAGTLADYVPFYFCPRSPMLYANHGGGVVGAPAQDRILHLVSEAESIDAAGLPFCFSDSHAVTQPTGFHDNLASLSTLNWPYVNARDWRDTPQHPDRKRRKQAEFLVRDELPWRLVSRIGVMNAATATAVAGLLAGVAHVPQVLVRPDWYY